MKGDAERLADILEGIDRVQKYARQQHSEVPWPQIAGMRNIIVHDYFGVDLEQVWQVVDRDLPVLRDHVTSFLKDPQ